MKLSISGLSAALAIVSVAEAQNPVRPFPMQPIESAIGVGESFAPQLDQIQLLTAYDSLTMTGIPVGDGSTMALDLERLDTERLRFGFQVDGLPRPDLADGLDLSIWKGTLPGQPDSEVLLSFSNQGSRGWITGTESGEVLHFIGQPDASGDWASSEVIVVRERELNANGMALPSFCELDAPLAPPAESSRPVTPPPTQQAGTCGLYECTIAVETDWQLNQVFGGLSPMTAYMTTLLTAISDRYEEQIGTVLTFPYLQFYSNSNDPWSTPDSGGSTIDMLNEFRGAWLGNIPTGASLAHFISGAGLGGGVAYLDVLCNPSFAFGVSANIDGDVQFPVTQQSGNWDFMVIAHELGHNFSAPHTHDLGIDNCAGGQCISNGTVMSYCHLCSGGTANVTTYFHPINVANMTSAASSCLPFFGGAIYGDDLDLLSDTSPTTVQAIIAGTPAGSVDLKYRYSGGSFQTISMTPLGGNLYEADLPAASCDDTPEYYFTFTEASCGTVTDPEGAPGNFYTAGVGSLNTIYSENFETNTGWSPSNLGASSGDWQRGVPVDDNGWDYDPESDYDGSGSAWLTQNQNGNTDVDNGAVRLTSPALDMSDAGAAISYAYFLRLTNQDGTDALIVEISTNGGSGGWTEIARHDTDGGLSWREHLISASDLAAAGVNPTANSVLRFTANDGNPQSIVEAGLDAFSISTLSCDGGDNGQPGDNFCISGANSTGAPASISALGSNSIAANDLVLQASPMPPFQNGLFYYGQGQTQQPFGNGTRCVTGSQVFRLAIESSDFLGLMTHSLDNTMPPGAAGQLLAGSTWNFQAWFRDPAAGGAAFDLSDGYTITFTP